MKLLYRRCLVCTMLCILVCFCTSCGMGESARFSAEKDSENLQDKKAEASEAEKSGKREVIDEIEDTITKLLVPDDVWKENYKKIIYDKVTDDSYDEDPWEFMLTDLDENGTPELLYQQYTGARGFVIYPTIVHFTNGKIEEVPIDISSSNGMCSLCKYYINLKTGKKEWIYNWEYTHFYSESIDLQRLVLDLPNNTAYTETIVQTGTIQYEPDCADGEAEAIIKTWDEDMKAINYHSMDSILVFPNFTGTPRVLDKSRTDPNMRDMQDFGDLTDEVITDFLNNWWND